jgi:ribose transport system ATP-binding protein
MREEQTGGAATPRLEVKGVWKGFPGVQALADVNFELRSGEIHAVVGENGAGKSTLMNILSGVHHADRGQIVLDGRTVHPEAPRDAFDLGISIVHQETSLCPNLSVAENIFVHAIPTTWSGMVDFRTLYQKTESILSQFSIKARPKTPVKDLGIAQQQLVEIAKASVCECRVLILDEPTSALAPHEEAILFAQVRRMKERGTSVIYISHRLREVFELTDRVTVLKDGRVIGTCVTRDTNQASIVSMMVGRELSQLYPEKSAGIGETVLDVRHLTRRPLLKDISFSLHRGEILGVAGLVGAGRTEMALAIFGADPEAEGTVTVEGRPVRLRSSLHAIQGGMGYLPEDRRVLGLFMGMDVRQNVVSAHLGDFAGSVFMNNSRERAEAEKFVKALSIRTPSIYQRMPNLSGGNQQKVVVSKWLSIAPKILIVDEPTRGIDVGAKAEIHAILRNLATEGVAIIMISSELPEIIGMSDRILVMHDGRMSGILSGQSATEDEVMSYAIGSKTSPAPHTEPTEAKE